MEPEAARLEKQHVHDVYESTAPYLSHLQSRAWPRVRQFLQDQKPGSLVADIGCGTGKYLQVNSQVHILGCDYCRPLVEIARAGGSEVMVCDNLNLPFRDQGFDAVISIGVIHHFSTRRRRSRAVGEMARVLAPGGRLLIYVWAMEQKNRRFARQDVLVPWNGALCSGPRPPEPGPRPGGFYSALGRSLRAWLSARALEAPRPAEPRGAGGARGGAGGDAGGPAGAEAPGRTRAPGPRPPEPPGPEGGAALTRYYHVFRAGELGELLRGHARELRVLSAGRDHGNWCVLAEKRRGRPAQGR
ncbi:probable tRNA methyltransferase 9B [Perognathus longimembris pacificus]|uniref:probable tRNA methyltransferase 9B n=1 Tax=Perognathus longimembris pacificus TaxID=214514 RepID=UPI002019426C|nr:probable tRNA methyltransferase 9B [Perognathus longimembris pacificus]